MNAARSIHYCITLLAALVAATLLAGEARAQELPAASPDEQSAGLVRDLMPRLLLTTGTARFEGGPLVSTLDANGLSVTVPAGSGLRSDAAGTATVTALFRLREVRAGGQTIAQGAGLRASHERPEPTTRQASTDGGTAAGFMLAEGIEELYEPRLGGVEQLVRFQHPLPADTDLEVIVDVETSLIGEHDETRGVVFRDASGGEERLFYGQPTIIDAAGKYVSGLLSWNGSAISILFQAHKLKGLSFPILLDPLIGTSFTIISSSNSHG